MINKQTKCKLDFAQLTLKTIAKNSLENLLIEIRDSNSLSQLSFKSTKIIEDSLRGGGCGPSIITEKEILDISTKKIKLPKEFFDQLKKNCYLLITHSQMSSNDQRSQTSILFGLQWFHYNCEYIQQCCKKDNDVGLIYQIFLNYAEQILKEVPNYLRSNGFIAYRVLQVINELLRVVFSFQINNENHQFDEGKKIELIELTEIIRSELEIEQNEIWVTGVDYELKLIEIMIHNCNINYSGNGVIMTAFIKQLILSVVNSTIQDGLVESLIDAAEYVFNIPYEKIVYPKELYIQYYYFQALKYKMINEIQNNQSIQTQIEKLINLYKKYVQSSNNWIVHYSWITMICDLLSYRGIIFRDSILNTIDGLQHWNFMVEKNFIKPFPQQKFGVIQLYTNYYYINFNNKQDIHEKIGGYNLFCDALMKEQLGDDNIQFWKKYTKFTFIEQTFQNSNLMIKSIGTEVLEASTSVLQEKISSTNCHIIAFQRLITNFRKQKTELDFQLYHNELQATNSLIWNNTIQLIYILNEIYEKEKLISMQIKLLINTFNQKGKYNNQIQSITQNQSKFKESYKTLMSEIQAYQFSCIKIEYLCSNLKFLNQSDFEKIEFDNLETIFNPFLECLSKLLINDKTFRSTTHNDLLEENKNSIPQTKGIPQITAKHQDLIKDLKELFKVPIIDSYVSAIQFSLQPIQPASQNLLLDVKLLIKYLQILINLFKILYGKINFVLSNFEITLFQDQTYVPNQNQEIDMATLKNLICNMLQNLRNIISVNYSLEINENLFQQRIKELSETLEQNTAIIASTTDKQTTKEIKQAKADAINIILELQNETLIFLISPKNDQKVYLKSLSEKIEEKLQVWKVEPPTDQRANQQKQEAQKNQELKFLQEKFVKDLQSSEKQLQEKIKKLEQCFINFRIEENAKKISQDNIQTPKAKEFYEILREQIQYIIEEVKEIIQTSTPVFDYSQTIQQPVISEEKLQQYLTECFLKADYQEWNLDELYQEIEEDIYKSTISTEVNQQSGSDHKVRECLVMNLLKIQESVSEEKILKFVQWQIKQMWILERNENVRSLLKNKDLLEMQRKLFSKDLKSFSSQIQEEMQGKLDQLSALEQQIRLEGNLEEQIRLQNQLKLAYQELDEYLENITDMSTQMNISLIFLKEIAKELKSIKNKIDTLTENVNQIANDVRKLRGKTFQELLVIRKKKVLDLARENEVDSIYIPLKTIELNSKTGDKIKSIQGKEITPLLVEKFQSKTSEDSLIGELNEFLWGENNQKNDVLLIRGQAGSGKSRSVRKIEEFLWKIEGQESSWIPIYVSLSQIKNPKFNLFEQAMDSEYYNFDSTQTKELKEAIRNKKINIIFIFDSYDEMKSDCIQQNLIITNNFISDFEIKDSGKFIKFIFATRIEILNPTKYRNQFFGSSLENLKDVELVKFDQDQIDEYLNKYIELSAKRVIKNQYIFFKEINQLEFNSVEFQSVWEKIEPIVIECNAQSANYCMLFQNKEEDTIISKIKYHKVFQHIKEEQTITLRKDLQQLWSSNMFKQAIQNVNIEELITTPFMLEIVVQVLPQMIKSETNLCQFKEDFCNNLFLVLKESRKSNKYLQIYQQKQQQESINVKKQKDKKFEQEKQEVQSIFEKLQELRFFLNYSQIDKLVVDNGAISIKELSYPIGKTADLVAIALKLKKITIFEFYECFVASYHNQQIQKLVSLGKISNQDSFTIDVFNFSQSLALDLTINQLTQLNIKQKGKLKLNIYKGTQEENKNSWEEQYIYDSDDNLEYMKLIRSCTLLSTKGQSISFNHKSIQEFLVAKFLYEEISKVHLSLDQLHQVNQENQIIKSIYNKDEFNISKENYLGVLALLKTQLEYLPEIDEKLIYIVRLSLKEIFVRSASNSIYLLSQRNKFLGGMDFKQIRLRDTNLFALSFFGSDLSGSSFEKVVIDSCNFNFCNLNDTSWNNIICKEMPYLKGHKGTIFVVTFSHDGQLLASGGSDSQVIIWDLNTFNEKTIINHQEINNEYDITIKSVQFFQSSQRLATAGTNQCIKIFDISKLPDCMLLRYLDDHENEIIKIKFSLDEKTLYSLDSGCYVIIWNVENIFENINQKFLKNDAGLVDLVLTSKEDYYYAIDAEQQIIGFYDFMSEKCLNFISITDFNFTKLTLSRDDNYLASANEDGLVVIWDVSKKLFKLIWQEEYFYAIIDFSFSSNNQFLSILSGDVIVDKEFQNCDKGEKQIQFLNCYGIAFSSTDNLLALLGKQIIAFLDLFTNQIINSIENFMSADCDPDSKDLDEIGREFISNNSGMIKISKTQQLAYEDRQNNTLKFWNINTFQFLFQYVNEVPMILSQDQKLLVSMQEKFYMIQNLDMIEQKTKRIHEIKSSWNYFVAVQQQNSLIAFIKQKGLCVPQIKVRDLEDNHFEKNWNFDSARNLAFSSKGQFLIIVFSEHIILIALNQDEEQKKFSHQQNNQEIFSVATSFDDKILGAATLKNIILWDIQTNKIIANEEIQCNTKLLFGRSNQILAFGKINDIYFYEYKTKRSKIIYSHKQEVIDIAFSSNDQFFGSLGKIQQFFCKIQALKKQQKQL